MDRRASPDDGRRIRTVAPSRLGTARATDLGSLHPTGERADAVSLGEDERTIFRPSYDEVVFSSRRQTATVIMVSTMAFLTLSGCAVTTETLPTSGLSPASQEPRPGFSTTTVPAPLGDALTVDTSSSNAAPTLPWSLVRVDRSNNRIYLSSTSVMCTVPTKVHLSESSASITISVIGDSSAAPCTAQNLTMIGYVVTQTPIGDRTIQHANTN
jgi:hypothetical protein